MTATTMVVGASRGLGLGIAKVLADSAVPVIAVARSAIRFEEVQAVVADATDASAAGSLIDRYQPRNLVLVAGATPLVRPIQRHTWETFSTNWETDVRMTFNWAREALLTPLAPGSRVVVLSSGAALHGSPLSGGYAGAKATQRFIAAYAQEEANRDELGITFTSILPRITPLTELGRPAVEAYAARAGVTQEEYMQQMGPPVTPEVAGNAVLELLQTDPESLAAAYLLTGAGLKELP
ncbi:MAG TPA: SDR family oxidoreductase [Solirubrobacteraceae bacterium]|nr:SDR family oxidoreductase [Solirubrobacteraceae bacterium]